MDSSPDFRRRKSEVNEASPRSFAVADNVPPLAIFSTPDHGVGTSAGSGSNFPTAGDDSLVRHPAMHSSVLTPPCTVEPSEMMTPDPSARYIHGEQVREDFVPKKTMVFVTEEGGYDFYLQYARAAGFGITKLRRKPMSHLYACSREGTSTFYKPGEEQKRAKMSKRVNCKAAVKMKKKGKEWIYEKVLLEHNHTLNPEPWELKHIHSHKNKDPVIMQLVDDLQTCDVSPNATMNVLTKFHGNCEVMPWSERDLQNRKAANVRKERADDVKKLKAFFNECRAENSKFYYDIDHDSEGVAKNIFWSHASCQANYAEFGDVVSFDTTYKCNFYNKPLAMFVGSNHHLQNVIFGFALLGDEKEETFDWVFRTFKTCMENKEPHCILIDQDQAMGNALPGVFPNAIHRLCRWHVLHSHKDGLKVLYNLYDGLKEKLLTVINHPLTPVEFEKAWTEMVNEYGLESDPTIGSLYDLRARWITAYFKDVYCGRMTSTQRSESTNKIVKRNHIDPTTPLHVFARKMFQVLERRK